MSARVNRKIEQLVDGGCRVLIGCVATFFALLGSFEILTESMYGWEASTPSAVFGAGLYIQFSIISLTILVLGRGAGIRSWRLLAGLPVMGLLIHYAAPVLLTA